MDIKTKYDLGDFFEACFIQGHKQVTAIEKAEVSAREIFDIPTKKQLIAFISNDGLKNLRFLKIDPLSRNDIKGLRIVDTYDFDIIVGTKIEKGYLAFGKSENTPYWIIKSFHLQPKILSYTSLENEYRLALGKRGMERIEKINGEKI
jgi:hypothetical protein